MFGDFRRSMDKAKPLLDKDNARQGKDKVSQLTRQMERDECGSPGDDFTATREGFVGLYQSLHEAGQKPEADGALHPPEHPNVDLMPNGDVFGYYDDLKGYLKLQGLSINRKESKASGVMGFEAHHLMEKSRLNHLGFSEGEMLCVALYEDEHMQLAHGKEEGITTELRRSGKSKDGDWVSGIRYDIDTLVEGHANAYQKMGRPEWADRLRSYVRDNRERILEAYQNGTVDWATSTDIARVRKYLQAL